MRYLITGASGLIGTALGAALRDRGDEVVVMARPGTPDDGTRRINWNPSDGSLDEASLEQAGAFQAVFHLAGAGIADRRWSKGRKAEILESRVRSTEMLVQAIGRGSLQTAALVSGSAIGYYGDRGGQMLVEGSTRGTGYLAEVCAAWEAAARPAANHGVRTVLARTGIVLSVNGGALAKQLPLFRAGVGGRLGNGSQWMSWISITDEVAALITLADDPQAEGAFNVTSPHPVTNREFTRLLAAAVRRPAVFAVPPPALKLALGSELVDEALLASQRVLPEGLQTLGFDFAQPDLEGALAEMLT